MCQQGFCGLQTHDRATAPTNGHSVPSPLFPLPARALDVFMALSSVVSTRHTASALYN